MVSAAVVPSKTDAESALVKEGALLVGWAGVVEPPPPLPAGVVEPLPLPPPPHELIKINHEQPLKVLSVSYDT